MKAIVYHGIEDIRYEPDWPEPRPLKPGEVLVAPAWVGICGTDIEDLHGGRHHPHP